MKARLAGQSFSLIMRGREKNDWGLCVHVSVSQECNQTYCHVLGTRLVVSPRESCDP